MERHQDALVGGALEAVEHVPVVAERGGAEQVRRDVGADVVALAFDPARFPGAAERGQAMVVGRAGGEAAVDDQRVRRAEGGVRQAVHQPEPGRVT